MAYANFAICVRHVHCFAACASYPSCFLALALPTSIAQHIARSAVVLGLRHIFTALFSQSPPALGLSLRISTADHLSCARVMVPNIWHGRAPSRCNYSSAVPREHPPTQLLESSSPRLPKTHTSIRKLGHRSMAARPLCRHGHEATHHRWLDMASEPGAQTTPTQCAVSSQTNTRNAGAPCNTCISGHWAKTR